MRIITISREFGSGGRELGKRLADSLNYNYFDREIVSAIAKDCVTENEYVENSLSFPTFRACPITIGKSLSFLSLDQQYEIKQLQVWQEVLKSLAAQGNCIVMGQGADYILRKYRPLNLFVYADLEARLRRCKERAQVGEITSDKELKKQILQVDVRRAERYELIASAEWGKKENYHLCVNTTGTEIKTLVPIIAKYAQKWFNVTNQEDNEY